MLDAGEVDVAITVPLTEYSRILFRPPFEGRLACILRQTSRVSANFRAPFAADCFGA